MAANELKKCSVRIGDVYYQLVTAENESYTRKIAAHADEMIHRVQQDNPQLSQAMATVLALVNAVDELARAYQQLKSMEGQHLDLDQKASEARRELARLREQHWEMKKELLRVTELNRDYQSLINRLTQDKDRDKPDPAGAPEQVIQPDIQDQPDTQDQPAAAADPGETDGARAAAGPAEIADAQTPDPEQADLELADSERTEPEQDDPQPLTENSETVPDPEEEAGGELPQTGDRPKEDSDTAHKTLDRLQQTNLDDYLRAFGLTNKAGDTTPAKD